jgi:hypothetical protein
MEPHSVGYDIKVVPSQTPTLLHANFPLLETMLQVVF